MSDGEIQKQFPFSIKAEATAQGFRISGHVYGDNMEQCVTDLGNMLSKTMTELEKHELVLAANQKNEAVTPTIKVKAK
jgi:hypothetical protein